MSSYTLLSFDFYVRFNQNNVDLSTLNDSVTAMQLVQFLGVKITGEMGNSEARHKDDDGRFY